MTGVRRAALALALAAGVATPSFAQVFGQNKVRYGNFGFKVVQTEHFDVHYYDQLKVGALDVARMAERSYARLSTVLNHKFRERKVIILYASPSDFQQTNTTPGEVGEGTGGFTDYFKQRNIFPLTGAYAEIDHVLTHEMTHQFQMDVFSNGRTVGSVQQVATIAPPLWFMEGMAEYLSLGPVTPETAMWLRDAVLEDRLPTIEQLTFDQRIFPYRFGHALWSYVAERWGDEAIGAVLAGVPVAGWEQAIRRSLGVSVQTLTNQWRDAVRAKYYPELGEQARARRFALPALTGERTAGTLHLAPALSPDGTQFAFFGEGDFYFVDLWLADAATGKITRRLLNSTWSADYETFRFINSQAAWSPDGTKLAFAVKHGPRDDIVVLDVKRNAEVRRIRVGLNGLTTPAWSPDGRQLVFTGYDGGLSDLFIVNSDGTGLRRLTNDKYADLLPAWSPDGRTIAFTTDRGPGTDFARLSYGNYRIALYDLTTSQVRILPQMEHGKNVNPVWSPDGNALAFVSDRDGVSNIYLYELADDALFEITNVFTGVQGITPLSPVLSWARGADRLAFNYYERGRYDVYTIDHPQSLKQRMVPRERVAPAAPLVAAAPAAPAPAPAPEPEDTTPKPLTRFEGGLYRGARGFRQADGLKLLAAADVDASGVSLAALRDSAMLALPDTAEFTYKPYQAKLTPDYISRPNVGFVRDNFGQGFYGGASVSLSDMLGNHNLTIGGVVNGRLEESQILAAYTNLSHRIIWTAGVQQSPLFFYSPSTFSETDTSFQRADNLRRLIFRSGFGRLAYPLSRFQRLEGGLAVTNVDDSQLQFLSTLDKRTGFTNFVQQRIGNGSFNYFTPSVALVYDNTLFGYTGPILGQRYRVEFAQTLGDWSYRQYSVDLRKYQSLGGPFVLASRLWYLGREGTDASRFPIFIGYPDLLRGYTAGSFQRRECNFVTTVASTSTYGCGYLDQLVGSNAAVASVELRFPLLTPSLRFVPQGFPPIEGALYYDVGMAWNTLSQIQIPRNQSADPTLVRTPLQSVGVGIRTNILGFLVFRLDWSFMLNRPSNLGDGNYYGDLWTIALGPTF